MLSPEGELLLSYAQRLFRLADEAESELRTGKPMGVFRIGSLESTAGSRLAPILSRFHRLYPGVVVELVTGTTGALVQRVAQLRDRGRVRLRAVHRARPARRCKVFEEELVLITAKDAPAVRARRRPGRLDPDRFRQRLLLPQAAGGLARRGAA